MSGLRATSSGRRPPQPTTTRASSLYVQCLGWLFALFSSTRIVSYLPTLWAIYKSADSGQHSLFTWLVWLGSNLTMAAWMFESAGRRMNPPIAVQLLNATMCLLTAALIVWYRL